MASFSYTTKVEATRASVKNDCCRRAELYAMLRFGSALNITFKGFGVTFSTSLDPIAQRMNSLIRRVYDYDCEIRRVEKEQLGKLERIELVSDGPAAKQMLLDSGMLRESEDGVLSFEDGMGYVPERECCRDAYLRAVFLACGTMQPPEKGYHLEFVLDSEALANDLCSFLFSFGWNVHITMRKEKPIVYMKEAGCIAEFLAHIGAHAAYLALEDERLLRDINNEVNRSVNCDSGNLKKTTDAAQRQIRAIELLEREGILRRQPLGIRQTAELRLDYPEASLDELTQMSTNVTRAGINHRLRRLVALAEELDGEL